MDIYTGMRDKDMHDTWCGCPACKMALAPIIGRCPKLRMLCETPLINGPALDVDSKSFVEAYSVM
jgi:hypothetical protein